ncbi:MAG: molybdopterin-dependent oxidoreductase [Holophagaceae bacterium]|nr:molybdopterin-dependent oxidoreductase [Holophagaceae bacterium]
MDLVVDINFRMDTSALYSDIVLPTATWYEKTDLNSTDMHSFINPLSAAVPPCWESKSDWDIFKQMAKKVSELSAKHLPNPIDDIVSNPLAHDTPAEIAQPHIRDWMADECEAIPGKTMPGLTVITRDYSKIYDQFISLGPNVREQGLGAHGVKYPIKDVYDRMLETHPTEMIEGQKRPSLKEDLDAANVLLHLAPETNGELAYRAYQYMEGRTGLPLKDLAEPTGASSTPSRICSPSPVAC